MFNLLLRFFTCIYASNLSITATLSFKTKLSPLFRYNKLCFVQLDLVRIITLFILLFAEAAIGGVL